MTQQFDIKITCPHIRTGTK